LDQGHNHLHLEHRGQANLGLSLRTLILFEHRATKCATVTHLWEEVLRGHLSHCFYCRHIFVPIALGKSLHFLLGRMLALATAFLYLSQWLYIVIILYFYLRVCSFWNKFVDWL